MKTLPVPVCLELSGLPEMGKEPRLWLLTRRVLLGEDSVATVRKTARKTPPAKTGLKLKPKSAKKQRDAVSRPPTKPASATALLPEPPGFLIVGIGDPTDQILLKGFGLPDRRGLLHSKIVMLLTPHSTESPDRICVQNGVTADSLRATGR